VLTPKENKRSPASGPTVPSIEAKPGDRQAPPHSPSRLRGVDGFRALAVLSVLVYHNWLYTAAGHPPVELGYLSRFVLPHLPVGVTAFFTLSGFLLYRPIVSCVLDRRPLQSLPSYFRNRALRIIPAYWAILFATAVLLPATITRVSPTEVQLGRLVGQPTVLLRNAALTQNYFGESMDTGIAPAWSLAVEVIFYLVLPFLGILAAFAAARASTRRGNISAVLTPPILLFCVGLGTAFVGEALSSDSGTLHGVLVRSFLNHADLFAPGMGLAVLMVCIEKDVVKLPGWWRIPTYSLLLAAVCITVLVVDRGLLYTYKGAVPYELLTSLSATLLLALVVLPSANGAISVVTRILDMRVLAAIGLVSYSLFLWHEPVQRWADQHGLTLPGVLGFWVNLLALGLVASGLAALTYRFVERPALGRKSRVVAVAGPEGPIEPVKAKAGT
jgi:peptidoglycan/LPS O-acetylase OafA/YrhL